MHDGKVDVGRCVLGAEVLAGAVGPVLWRALAPGVEARPQAALGPEALLAGGHLHGVGDTTVTTPSDPSARIALWHTLHCEACGRLQLDDMQYQLHAMLLQQWAYQVPGVNALDILGNDIDAGGGLLGSACTAQKSAFDDEMMLKLRAVVCWQSSMTDRCRQLPGSLLQSSDTYPAGRCCQACHSTDGGGHVNTGCASARTRWRLVPRVARLVHHVPCDEHETRC